MKIHCWYVITTDNADNMYLGCEGPFWTEEEKDKYILQQKATRGIDQIEVIEVPERNL